MGEFICPQPNFWYKIWGKLREAWEQGNLSCPPPPASLVLSGWTMTDDYDKKDRWSQTLDWAKANKLEGLIPSLSEAEKYSVEVLHSFKPYERFGFSVHPKKYKPSVLEIEHAMISLKRNWKNYLGTEFAENTEPIKFTGDKARRLLVIVKSGYEPPWGSWTEIKPQFKEIFSNLRKHINSHISPLEIDHIDIG